MPEGLTLLDRHGRIARDLRVSVTDKCTLRCRYCMPAEGMAWLANEDLLTDAEINRLVALAVTRFGVTSVRFTGGEPLLRRSLEQIVAATAALRHPDGGRLDISITTNALGLRGRAQALADAGLQRVNVSLDSLDRERFAHITRRDELPRVLEGIEAAAAAGLTPVKLNAVPRPDSYREDAPALLDFALRHGHQLRFIEEMPIGLPETWDHATIVTVDDLLTALADAGFDLTPDPAPRLGAPAALWQVAASGDRPGGSVGMIGSVTQSFCSDCTRTRLTADGQIRSCLFSDSETDLRGALRAGASDDEIAELWRAAMWAKPAAHGMDRLGFAAPSRTMSAIGG